MTLGTLERHFKEMREQGATDDSEVYVYVYARTDSDFSRIESIEFDDIDNSINIYPE